MMCSTQEEHEQFAFRVNEKEFEKEMELKHLVPNASASFEMEIEVKETERV